MIGMRKAIAFLMVTIFAGFALPAIADSGDKYRIAGPTGNVTSGTAFTVTITNRSNFDFLRSFTITAPPGVKITSVASGSSNIPGTKITPPDPNIAGGTISVTGLTIPWYGSTTTGKLTITATFPASCALQTPTWISTAKGGLIAINEPFALDGLPLTTTFPAGSCSMSFATQPADTIAGSIITSVPNNPQGAPVQVQLLINGAPAPDATPVQLFSACTISGGGGSTTNGVAAFGALTSGPGALCQLTAKATGFPDATSGTFNVLAQAGAALGCDFATNTNTKGGTLDPTQEAFMGTPGYGVLRAPNISGTCAALPWAFNQDLINNTASFIAVKGGQVPAVEYVVLFSPVPRPASGWLAQPQVSWGINNPQYPADYVPALLCLDDDVNLGSAVIPTIPDIPPYQGNIHPQFQPNQPALMCIAQQGSTAPTSGFIQQWVKVIDQSDGYIKAGN